MSWEVHLFPDFARELESYARDVRKQILIYAQTLEAYGPTLGRPRIGVLTGSKYTNLKEMRISVSDGEWRVAFAFDPQRRAILLVAGDKTGVSETRFYKGLIGRAEERYGRHLRQSREAQS